MKINPIHNIVTWTIIMFSHGQVKFNYQLYFLTLTGVEYL